MSSSKIVIFRIRLPATIETDPLKEVIPPGWIKCDSAAQSTRR